MSDPIETGGPQAASDRDTLTDTAAGRLVGALVSPRATFESIRQRPTWVLALVVLLLATIATQAVVYSQVDMIEVMRQQMEAQGQEFDDDQLAQMENFAYIGPACGMLLVPVGYAVFGLILMVLVNLAGGEVKFHGAMAIVTHGTMPLLVAGLLSVLVVLAGADVDPVRMQLEGGILSSNLAFLAPSGASAVQVVLLSAIDVFSVWNLVLLVMGVSIVGGVGTGAGAAMVGLLWVLWIGFRVAMAFLSGGAGG